ncbi:uncharacterized protein LOC133464844 [Cololabis saira]|uniref:uncharacterized protein LOC133464844 n=1 Tax=Cololabis saira TaxID=129043 RepID=UPI002AD213C2|nr:uncharacterized protein LOC133464844 [Cololabis saira]
MTPRLQLFISLLLHFEAGISGGWIFLYHRPGNDAVLPSKAYSSNYQCSNAEWIHYKYQYKKDIVLNGTIVQTSPGADRMSLRSDCSLIINNITAEDAGEYLCWNINDHLSSRTLVYLSVLTVSPSPPDVDPGRDGDVTLRCSLVRFYGFSSCERYSIVWVDETGSVLLGERDGFLSGGQNNCVSDLMVKHQRRSKRRFTCQVVEGDRVVIDAEYTLDFTAGTGVRTIILYHRVGDDVALQNNVDLSSSTCSNVEWIYSRDTSSASHEEFGSGAGRMDRKCSLIITNITAGDAGLYESRLRDKYNTVVYLSVLTTGTGVRTIILYHRAGDDVNLQNNVDLSSSNCSDVEWIYSRDTSSASHEEFGSGAGRMDRKCSLIITNITAGDAGLYESRLRDKYNTVVYLTVLTSEYLDCVGNSATKNTQPLLGLSVPGRVSLFGSCR